MKTRTLRISDKDHVLIQVYAQSRGMSINAAVLELIHTALATAHRGPSFTFTSGHQTTMADGEELLQGGFGT